MYYGWFGYGLYANGTHSYNGYAILLDFVAQLVNHGRKHWSILQGVVKCMSRKDRKGILAMMVINKEGIRWSPEQMFVLRRFQDLLRKDSEGTEFGSSANLCTLVDQSILPGTCWTNEFRHKLWEVWIEGVWRADFDRTEEDYFAFIKSAADRGLLGETAAMVFKFLDSEPFHDRFGWERSNFANMARIWRDSGFIKP